MKEENELLKQRLLEHGGKARDLDTTNLAVQWVIDMPKRFVKPTLFNRIWNHFVPWYEKRLLITGEVVETYVCEKNENVLVMTKPVPLENTDGMAFGTLLPKYTTSQPSRFQRILGVFRKKPNVKFFDTDGNEV